MAITHGQGFIEASSSATTTLADLPGSNRWLKVTKITTNANATIQSEGVDYMVKVGVTNTDFPGGQWVKDLTVSANAGRVAIYYL